MAEVDKIQKEVDEQEDILDGLNRLKSLVDALEQSPISHVNVENRDDTHEIVVRVKSGSTGGAIEEVARLNKRLNGSDRSKDIQFDLEEKVYKLKRVFRTP